MGNGGGTGSGGDRSGNGALGVGGIEGDNGSGDGDGECGKGGTVGDGESDGGVGEIDGGDEGGRALAASTFSTLCTGTFKTSDRSALDVL